MEKWNNVYNIIVGLEFVVFLGIQIFFFIFVFDVFFFIIMVFIVLQRYFQFKLVFFILFFCVFYIYNFLKVEFK